MSACFSILTLCGILQVHLVTVDLRGAAFKISRSTQGAKFLKYYKTPTFDFANTVPRAFLTGEMASDQRMITVRGTNFISNAGGMYLRVSMVNGSSVSMLQQVKMTVVDTTSATAIMPTSIIAGVLDFELSINSDTWYHPGDVEYMNQPSIQLLTPSSGPVMGGSLVTITHTRVPLADIGSLEAKVGQYYVPLMRTSETEMTLLMPKHTVDLDPSWYLPGNETLEIYLVGSVNPYTGAKVRFQLSSATNGTSAIFAYECAANEIATKTCCPPGTAGPGGNSGSFCFVCDIGYFAPHAGSTACLSCPPHTVNGNASSNCTCVAGFEYQLVIDPAQECRACDKGTYRNESMSYCSICPAGTIVSPARTSCLPTFAGCPENEYQPRNGTQTCCAFGHVLPIGAISCIPCPAGSFFNMTVRECRDCEAGTYGSMSSLFNCTRCTI